MFYSMHWNLPRVNLFAPLRLMILMLVPQLVAPYHPSLHQGNVSTHSVLLGWLCPGTHPGRVWSSVHAVTSTTLLKINSLRRLFFYYFSRSIVINWNSHKLFSIQIYFLQCCGLYILNILSYVKQFRVEFVSVTLAWY